MCCSLSCETSPLIAAVCETVKVLSRLKAPWCVKVVPVRTSAQGVWMQQKQRQRQMKAQESESYITRHLHIIHTVCTCTHAKKQPPSWCRSPDPNQEYSQWLSVRFPTFRKASGLLKLSPSPPQSTALTQKFVPVSPKPPPVLRPSV